MASMTESRSALQRGPARGLSALLAAPLALILLIWPTGLIGSDGHYSHGLLMAVMWGVSCGFIHSVGFDPRTRLWATLFHPLLGWLLMLAGYGLLLRAQGVF